MKNFIKNNEVINNAFVKDIKKDLQQFEVFSNKKNEIQFHITKKFIAENFNHNFNTKTSKVLKQSFVKEVLIGVKAGLKFEVIQGTLADTFKGFFVSSNVKRITKACNNVILLTELLKFNDNKDFITVQTVSDYLDSKNINGYNNLDSECQKQGIFSKNKDSKKPSGATNQDSKKDSKEVSIEQELKVKSKNSALQLLANIYPEFFKLNSKDKELVITKLSNAKNCNTSLEDFTKDLEKEDKKLAI
jgi:hypothetical protein